MNDLWIHAFTCEIENGNHVWKFFPSIELLQEFEINENWTPDIPLKFPAQWENLLCQMDQVFSSSLNIYKTSEDKIYRKPVHDYSLEESPLNKAIKYWLDQQASDGHWPSDYGGPLFLIPGYIFSMHVCGISWDDITKTLLKRYLINQQNFDGSWGLHIGGKPSLFSTVLQYVSLRLLGVSSDDHTLIKSRDWITKNKSVTDIPQWGKFYLSLIGLYDYQGMHAVLPELYMLPKWLPIHPSKLWCHTRMVYLPMAYLFGTKYISPENDLIRSIKSELYPQRFQNIHWRKHRSSVDMTDAYIPLSWMYKLAAFFMNLYDTFPIKHTRKRALKVLQEQLKMEDENTEYINLGPVNKWLNMICSFVIYGKDSVEFKKHVSKISYYLWIAEDGLKVQGYNGSQLWDAAFTVLALSENNKDLSTHAQIKLAINFIKAQRFNFNSNHYGKDFRNEIKGAWPFSTQRQGWSVSDCTAEALLAITRIEGWLGLSNDYILDSLRIILSMQNEDGGFSSYESARTGSWIEILNPASIFGDIMTDVSYVECTSSCLQFLIELSVHKPDLMPLEVKNAIHSGIQYLLVQQRKDGSWYGNWGVCFTYGTWFAIEALVHYTRFEIFDSTVLKSIENAIHFLIKTQNDDGGWGESYISCLKKEYIPIESQIVQTSWALLAIMRSGLSYKNEISKGIQYLERMQRENGDWPQQQINGQFNKSCMISYSCYRNIFPIWALTRYQNDH